MILKIAWRNILKNKRRTIVTILLGTMCFTLMIFYEAFNQGARTKMIEDSVAMYSGYIQVQGKGYQAHPNYDNLIYNLEEVYAAIEKVKGIKSYTARLETFGLYSGKAEAAGGMLVGVDPSKEAGISRIKKALKKGRFLQDSDEKGVYLGVDLAKRLEVGLGEEIVLLSTAVDYSMAAGKMIVKGLFKTNFFDFDSRALFVNRKFMEEEFLAENIASHVIIQPEKKEEAFRVKKQLQKILDKEKYAVLDWRDTNAEFVQFMKIDYVFDHISFALLLIIVFFVIMIFSLITVYQRTKELGIMRAVGTSQKQIYKILFAELFILTLISLVAGGIAGSALGHHFEVNPIQLSFAEDLLDMYTQWGIYDLTMPAKLNWVSFFSGVIPVFVLMMLAVWYPAWKVNSLKPIDAIEER